MDVIVDVDGTLADCRHRLHWIRSRPKNYDAFAAGCVLDPVIEPVAAVVRALAHARHRVIICSGRTDAVRAQTEDWLTRASIDYSALYMRTAGDFRPDDVIKLELLAQMRADGFDPVIAVDDRAKVVVAWRRQGLICAQVAEGDF